MMSEFVKIVFDLERDPEEDSFPPISAEALNAKVVEHGFVLDNTPFFAVGVALGDVVAAVPAPGAEGKFKFVEVVEQSTAKSLSIIFLSPSVKEFLYQELKGRGCYCEYGEFGSLQMLAVSVPETCDYGSLFEYLNGLEEREELSFAELAV